MKNLTILVAGPYTSTCLISLNHIRNLFPEAEIVLSTYKKVNIFENGFDKVVLSDSLDENYKYNYIDNKKNNVNSQIKSVVAGLKEAKGEYVFKLRTDFMLVKNSFLKYWDMMPKSEVDFRIFKHKILDCSYFSRDPRSIYPYPYHPSDMVLFGLKEDLLNLFDVPFMTKDEAIYNLQDKKCINQFLPEQHIFMHCLKKSGKKIKCNFYNEVSEENIIETERYFASNFIFLDFKQFGVLPSDKFKSIFENDYQSCITHVECQKLYKKYVDPNYVVSDRDYERERITRLYSSIKKYPMVQLVSNIIAFCLLGKKNKAIRHKVRSKVRSFFESKKDFF